LNETQYALNTSKVSVKERTPTKKAGTLSMFASMGGCCFGNSFSLFQFFGVFFATAVAQKLYVGNGDEVSNEKM